MSKLKITGGNKLNGQITISGAKNAALKILPAAILADSPSTIHNVPDISDVRRMIEILQSIGANVEMQGNTVTIDPTNITSTTPDPKLVNKLRASIVLVGPLLARFGTAVFTEPGGCLIGARSIGDHLDIFEQMGISINLTNGAYHLEGKPEAKEITLNAMSVTATENAIMAAVLSPGKTTIHMAAAEPEIADLANFLNSMGAKVSGAGTHDVEIIGVDSMHGANHTVIPDRIEAGTFLIAAIASNSNVTIGPIIPHHLAIVFKKIQQAGGNFAFIEIDGKTYIETHEHNALKPVNIDTRTYPGFPTDLQSPFVVLMTQAEGQSRVFETIFEGRFRYISELQKMKAHFEILSPHIVQIYGPTALKGKEIVCEDIRGGAALVIAALIAEGETVIDHAELIDRGYERIDEKLRAVGIQIEKSE